jgi:hypothetical protein
LFGRKPFLLHQFLLFYLLWHGQSIKYYYHPTWKEGWTSLVLSNIGYLTENNDSKHIQNTMVIQIYSGRNHPKLWDQLKQQTHNAVHCSKQIRENNLRSSKYIQNTLLHGT